MTARKWMLFKGDIKNASLQGDPIEADGEIFGEPPPELRDRLGLGKDEIIKFLKAAYESVHAPRAFWKTFTK